MLGIALLELMLLLLVLGLVAWALGAARNLPQSQREQARRLELALAEIRQHEPPHLREPLKQVLQYGRNLHKLLPQMAELERFLHKPGLEGATRDPLWVRYHELERAFERGVAYLERLGAELVLVSGDQEPPALADLPLFVIELREVLHPASPTRG
ncbi:hypothetical protein [Meiothermus sp.]|jgi:hypothetical protein|uniref:hypothetical protein n=1 Tax=Meiothermus sp. TaxID=1955249 RepID=UPI0021DCE633|nr:hypothetical protein [Meiothermus sp.]GIW26192.1 MAG: hypothetical protein KatS3mg069_2459 [Meiothermus sp.]